MKNFRLIISLAWIGLIIIVTSGISFAAETMNAPEVLNKVEAGTMILLDIRSPQEWKETGIASVAVPLTMHSKTFLPGLIKIVAENPNKKIGIICATGGRTAWLQTELAKRGLGEVIDVNEGMLGNKIGRGWISRGLPIKKVK